MGGIVAMSSTINASTASGGGVITTADASGILQLQTAGVTGLTIDASQNVGIGTSSPNGKLDVRGAAIFGSPNTFFVGDDGGSLGAFLNETAAVPMRFLTSGTERMRLDSGGSLYLNTTAQVGNTLQVMGLKFNGATQWGLSFGNLNSSNAGSAINFCNYAGTQIGTIQLSASATAYVTSSDYRLKENIQPMVGALDTIAQLKPVTYTWLEDGANGQGFIAHELQEIFPDAVAGEKDAVAEDGSIVPQGIDPSKLVATLTAAIQELKVIIDTQNARIEALEAK